MKTLKALKTTIYFLNMSFISVFFTFVTSIALNSLIDEFGAKIHNLIWQLKA